MFSTPIKAIVFDFDGTLAQPTLSFPKMNQAAIDAVSALLPGAPPKQEPALEWLKKVYVAATVFKDEEFAKKVCQAADFAMSEVEVEAVLRGSLFPETRQVLEKLRQANIKTAIITRNCRRAVLAVLPNLEEQFQTCLLSRDDISKWKPNPAHLQAALNLLNTLSQNSLMVGDDPMDIQVGKSCNSRTAAVLCGHSTADKLLICNPDFIAENCGELLTTLQNKGLINLN